MIPFWIIVTGALVASACSVLGCWLMLRRMAMLGDAISHSVLPGIVLAFLWTGSRNTLPMLAGAGTVGLLSAALSGWLGSKRKMMPDAALGIVFTAMFALGVVLVSRYAEQVDLDLDCVLYGEISYVPLDTWTVLGWSAPRAFWLLSAIMAINLSVVALLYKELSLWAFDPQFAQTLGMPLKRTHYLLMALVALTVVACFELVGAILVVAFLIAPAATAYLLTKRLPIMLTLSMLIGVLTALLGYGLARYLDASIAGCMATVSGLLFLGAFACYRVRHSGKTSFN